MFDLSCFCQEAIILSHWPFTLSCAMNGRLAPLLYSPPPNSLSKFLCHSSSSPGPHSGLFTCLFTNCCLEFILVTPPPSPFTSLFLSNITVPSFISTHSTLGNSSLSNPSTVLQEDCYNFVHVVVGTHHSLSLTYPPLLCGHLGLLSLQLWLFLC